MPLLGPNEERRAVELIGSSFFDSGTLLVRLTFQQDGELVECRTIKRQTDGRRRWDARRVLDLKITSFQTKSDEKLAFECASPGPLTCLSDTSP